MRKKTYADKLLTDKSFRKDLKREYKSVVVAEKAAKSRQRCHSKEEAQMDTTERDVFLWLKRPTVAQMKEALQWAHKRALRTDICYSNIGDVNHYPSDIDFDSILKQVDKKSTVFFRIVVRRGLNEMFQADSADQQDLLGLFISVWVDKKEYDVCLYLSTGLLGSLRRKFPMGENIVQ